MMMTPPRPLPSRRERGYANEVPYTAIGACKNLTEIRGLQRLRVVRATVVALALVLLLSVAAATDRAHADGRVAMILAAEDYQNFKRSEIGVSKGEEVAEVLRARGFDTTIATNPANAAARAALRDFAAKVSNAEVALAILMGHGLSSVGQTFFLPSNAAIDRSTDLLSRGLSITNIAQIVARAQVGGVCFLMTTPNFAKPIDGVDVKPQFESSATKNVAVAFSNSARIPISRIDTAAGLAANEVVSLLQKQPNTDLRQLINACGSQQHGSIYGVAAAVSLTVSKARPDDSEKEKKPTVSPIPIAPAENYTALEALERLLDPRQVRRIQTKLAEMGLYQGPIDAIVGVLTRNAIKEYQKRNGVAETGFLTPEQLAALTKAP